MSDHSQTHTVCKKAKTHTEIHTLLLTFSFGNTHTQRCRQVTVFLKLLDAMISDNHDITLHNMSESWLFSPLASEREIIFQV